MLKSFAIVSMLTGLLTLTFRAGLAQGDPVAVQQQLLDALARGDVAGALALFTEDAVIDAPSGLCAAAPCVGRSASASKTWTTDDNQLPDELLLPLANGGECPFASKVVKRRSRDGRRVG